MRESHPVSSACAVTVAVMMTDWQKERPHTTGELEFHFTGIRRMDDEAGREIDWTEPLAPRKD